MKLRLFAARAFAGICAYFAAGSQTFAQMDATSFVAQQSFRTVGDRSNERWSVDGGAVEQSWRYDHAPAGSDSLVVRVSVSGLPFRAQTEDGLLFGDGAERVQYGRATWVDANGTRTDVSERFDREEGAIALEVPRALLDRSIYPATLDPTISSVSDVESSFTLSPSFRSNTRATAATRVGNAAFVVWGDGSHVLSARADMTTGLPTTPGMQAIPITSGTHTLYSPAVAFDGESTIAVAWNEAVGGQTEIRVAFVDATTGLPKTAADAAGKVVVSGLAPEVQEVRVQWDGANFVLLWPSGTKGTEPFNTYVQLYTARIDSTTALPLAADGHGVVMTAMAEQNNPSFVCGTTGCLVAWVASSGTHYAHYDPTSGRQVDDVVMTTTLANSPFVTWDGTRFLVVAATVDNALHGRFVGVTSAAPSGSTFSLATGAFGSIFQALIYDGSAYDIFSGTMVWRLPPNVDSGGAPALVHLLPAVMGSGLPSVVANGSGQIFVTTTFDTFFTEPIAAAFSLATDTIAAGDTDGTRAGIYLALGKNTQDGPVLASGSSTTWAAWADNRTSSLLASTADSALEQMYTAALDPTTGHAASDRAVAGSSFSMAGTTVPPPAMATDGTTALLASLTDSGVLFSRLDATGAVTEQATIGFPDNGNGYGDALAVSYGAGSYVVVISDAFSVSELAIDDAKFSLPSNWTSIGGNSGSSNLVSSPAIAFDGAHFLATWCQAESSLLVDIDGIRIAPDGTPIDKAPVLYASRLYAQGNALAYDPSGGYLAVWSDREASLSTFGIAGQRIDVNGAPVGSVIPIANSAGNRTNVAIASARDTANFLLAWDDDASGVSQIDTALVGTDGTVRQPNGVAISDADEIAGPPAVTAASSGALLVVYARDIAAEPTRLAVVHVTTGQIGGACSGDAQCATLACFDGFCCDKPCGEACETCSATPGKCTAVQSGSDPDTCKGAMSCSATGACLATNAQTCAASSDCASGFCVDGVCCDSACNGGCGVCNVNPGVCTVVKAGSAGANPSCKPYVCNGTSAACPTACSTSNDCAQPYSCAANDTCELLTGVSCNDSETLETANGLLLKCTPYACRAAACETTCESIVDCASGFLCDSDGSCINGSSPDLASGCASSGTGLRDGSSSGSNGSALVLLGAIAAVVTRKRRSRERRPRRRTTMDA